MVFNEDCEFTERRSFSDTFLSELAIFIEDHGLGDKVARTGDRTHICRLEICHLGSTDTVDLRGPQC